MQLSYFFVTVIKQEVVSHELLSIETLESAGKRACTIKELSARSFSFILQAQRSQ
jgi:hypothetical protein